MTAADRPDNGQDEGRPWRVGSHYGVHVYQRHESQTDDRPVATFHRPEDAARAVAAVNAVRPGAGEQQREQVAAVLRAHGQADHDPQTGTFDCRCGNWSGNFLSYHQADQLLALLSPHTAEETR